MPKPKKKGSDEEVYENYRPSRLTLADFFTEGKPRTKPRLLTQSQTGGSNTGAVGVTETETASMTRTSPSTLTDKKNGGQERVLIDCQEGASGCADFGSSVSNTECKVDKIPAGMQEFDYFVMKTKKGLIPVTIENRHKGKKVTVIRNVYGKSEVLLSTLKKNFGTGGILSTAGEIELQGDQRRKIDTYFKQNPQLLRVYNGSLAGKLAM